MTDLSGTQSADTRVEELRKVEAEELAEALSHKYEMPYIDLTVMSVNTDALRLTQEKEAREAGFAGFKLIGKKVLACVVSPNNPNVSVIVEALHGKGIETELYMCSAYSLEHAWDRYKEISFSMQTRAGMVGVSDEQMKQIMTEAKTITAVKDLIQSTIDTNKTQGVSKILEIMLAGAISLHASDVHVESQESDVRLRFRLDGVLQDISVFSHEVFKLVLSRIKLISGLKLNIKQGAQDGRFSIGLANKQLEVRTSIIPGPYGESIVMRLLDPDSIAIELESMGMEPRFLQALNDSIAKPNGMILVTGPTGSGKSTTLYAFLRRTNNSETKIITIEDPIEYHLKGITQTQVNEDAGYTFLEGLRSALRQDPDIIMVGEIRDNETAKIAINSALTGHLVFSTLHTNSAAGAIPRLIDLGVNPKVIGSALIATMAQRLVRKLCKDCKKQTTPTEHEQKAISSVLEALKRKKLDPGAIDPNVIWTAGDGCPTCNGLGYKGRLGVFEVILMDAAVAGLIDRNPSAREIEKAAEPQGIMNMREDGIVKVLKGITSMDELLRVVDVFQTEDAVL